MWPYYWVIIKAGYATLQEMETSWSLTDVYMALESIRMFSAQEALYAEEAQRKAGHK